jgi:hypothetical protein
MTVTAPAELAPAGPAPFPRSSRREPITTGPVPWLPGDLGRLVMRVGLGCLIVMTAWIGASGTADFNEQVRWQVLGVAGLVMSAMGNSLWLLAGFRNTRARERALLAACVELTQLRRSPTFMAPSDELVAVQAGTRYHRSACALVDGKPTFSAARRAHEAAGLRPCGVCQP